MPEWRSLLLDIKHKVFYPKKNEAGYARIPALVCSAKDSLLAFCEMRSAKSDWAGSALVYKKSTDEGKTWSVCKTIMEEAAEPVSNPVPIIDADKKTIHFVFVKNYKQVYYCKSQDDGESFSEPVVIKGLRKKFKGSGDYKIIATGPGHGLQTKNGRLIVPVWLSEGGADGKSHEPNVASSIYSDDGGKSWQCAKIIPNSKSNVMTSYNESCAVQLKDGDIRLYMRNNSQWQKKAYTQSPTGIDKWSVPQFDLYLTEPICMMSGLNVNGSILLCTPNPKSWDFRYGRYYGKRHNLTCSLSHDEGKTWIKAVVESGPSAYSDLAKDSRGNIYCLYENGTKRWRGFRKKGVISIKKFTLEELKSKGTK